MVWPPEQVAVVGVAAVALPLRVGGSAVSLVTRPPPQVLRRRQDAKNTAEAWAAAKSGQLPLCSLSWSQVQAAGWPELASGEGPERSVTGPF